jgi:protein-S-isoprenylcysteine O-methyltransferase Ste14
VGQIWDRLPVPEQHVAAVLAGLVIDALSGRRLPRRLRWPGVALAATGLATTAAAVWSHRGADLGRPEGLVVGGVYRWTRNPMYVGWSLLHVGTAFATRSPGVLAAWPIAALLVHRDVLAEERQLTDRFGADYVAYAAAVPRYLLPRTTTGSGRETCLGCADRPA